jgi:hypothetical protein
MRLPMASLPNHRQEVQQTASPTASRRLVPPPDSSALSMRGRRGCHPFPRVTRASPPTAGPPIGPRSSGCEPSGDVLWLAGLPVQSSATLAFTPTEEPRALNGQAPGTCAPTSGPVPRALAIQAAVCLAGGAGPAASRRAMSSSVAVGGSMPALASSLTERDAFSRSSQTSARLV